MSQQEYTKITTAEIRITSSSNKRVMGAMGALALMAAYEEVNILKYKMSLHKAFFGQDQEWWRDFSRLGHLSRRLKKMR